MTTHYVGLRNKLKRREAEIEYLKQSSDPTTFNALLEAAATMANALSKIANHVHNCGCVPCTGSCRPEPQELVEEFQELAALALKSAGV